MNDRVALEEAHQDGVAMARSIVIQSKFLVKEQALVTDVANPIRLVSAGGFVEDTL